MENQPPSPVTSESLRNVMRKARLQARATAEPITPARTLSQLRLRNVFGNDTPLQQSPDEQIR
ncbi:MAG: hypothetical protein ACD_65C00345G0007 [uncultured bacterium]|nr:MAG: hypothetical protein ACD_65C00345G0007 [uncultured bacterium]KKT01819.1 MAG: hypothetical protein UV80_C0008G0029 [Candidatus Peregrinibacteria bacterium GW2011_GWF2_43_17]